MIFLVRVVHGLRSPGFLRTNRGSSLAFVGLVKESLELHLGGGLLLLHQVSMAFGDTPAVGDRHCWAEGTAGGRLQLLPVVTTGPTEGNTF